MKSYLTMHERVEMYINHRRLLGYTLSGIRSALLKFANYADEKGYIGPLTNDLTMEWATLSKKGTRTSWARRLALIHKLAKYCKAIEPETEIPPLNTFGATHRRPPPYIYTKNEIHKLLKATEGLKPNDSIKPITYRYLLGLLISTGLRISEAIKLSERDVDLKTGVLTIREAKMRKSRYVPLHHTTLKAMKRYVLLRNTYISNKLCPSFFITNKNRPLNIYEIDKDFGLLRLMADIPKKARLYDLRHTFACHRLLNWYKEDKNVDAMMVYLSTYLGHTRVIDTYWYLSATPELMSIVSKRFENFVNQIEGEEL